MICVKFFERALDCDLQSVVIVARCQGKFLFRRRAGGGTWELPGGPRATGEDIRGAAERVLREQTGAVEFQLEPVSAYGVTPDGEEETFGALYFAEIDERDQAFCDAASEELCFAENIPQAQTVSQLYPALLRCAETWLEEGNHHSEQDDLFDMMV